jgi:RNA polymerase sigma-70 factor (ECF subfamily)
MERHTSFEDFYRAEWASLFRAVSFTLGDRELAREATDEAMARAFERWEQVAAMASPAGWTFRVAVNFARNRVRRRWLERARPLRHDGPAHELDGVADPALARAVRSLPLDQRAVVVMRFYLDWPVDDVAAALGVAAGTVKSRLHRALRRLESTLREQS